MVIMENNNKNRARSEIYGLAFITGERTLNNHMSKQRAHISPNVSVDVNPLSLSLSTSLHRSTMGEGQSMLREGAMAPARADGQVD
ncbi:hypothetical protein JZ751_014646 [Albula glossodonta]|uniref:Uncharacterized protein n=1 Tax=Albula glossodonta TaxID=121402 RepID=A0A8T2N3Y4_9TELE|nr:hypothetical protein JZ751_014646 [Albula glossodonta]